MRESLTVGTRVRIHPASDWFMRGATHGVITSTRSRYAYVKLEHIGPSRLRARIAYDLLTPADQEGGFPCGS
jgi:hypothetical protein